MQKILTAIAVLVAMTPIQAFSWQIPSGQLPPQNMLVKNVGFFRIPPQKIFNTCAMTTSSVDDPFNGTVPIISSSPDEIVYDAAAASGTFILPAVFKSGFLADIGSDVKILGQGDDISMTYTLQGALPRVQHYNITIQLSETTPVLGQKFTSLVKARISGSCRKDKISGFGLLSGRDGSDFIRATQSSSVSGGPGDDYIFGSDGVDSLRGDKGVDLIFSGLYDEGDAYDTLDGDEGNDQLIVSDTSEENDYHLVGGSGVDITNYNGPTDDVIEIVDASPTTFVTAITLLLEKEALFDSLFE